MSVIISNVVDEIHTSTHNDRMVSEKVQFLVDTAVKRCPGRAPHVHTNRLTGKKVVWRK